MNNSYQINHLLIEITICQITTVIWNKSFPMTEAQESNSIY